MENKWIFRASNAKAAREFGRNFSVFMKIDETAAGGEDVGIAAKNGNKFLPLWRLMDETLCNTNERHPSFAV